MTYRKMTILRNVNLLKKNLCKMQALGINWHLINVPSFLFHNGTYFSADNPNIIINYKIYC